MCRWEDNCPSSMGQGGMRPTMRRNQRKACNALRLSIENQNTRTLGEARRGEGKRMRRKHALCTETTSPYLPTPPQTAGPTVMLQSRGPSEYAPHTKGSPAD